MTKKEFEELNCFEQAIEMEDTVVNAMGYEELAKELLRAMSIDDIIDYLDYIARMHDIEFYEEEI